MARIQIRSPWLLVSIYQYQVDSIGSDISKYIRPIESRRFSTCDVYCPELLLYSTLHCPERHKFALVCLMSVPIQSLCSIVSRPGGLEPLYRYMPTYGVGLCIIVYHFLSGRDILCVSFFS